MTERLMGTGKRYLHRQGYGFIESGDGDWYFFHRQDVKGNIRTGMIVTFYDVPDPGRKYPRAVDIDEFRPEPKE